MKKLLRTAILISLCTFILTNLPIIKRIKADGDPVIIRETGVGYTSLLDAVNAANGMIGSFTIEINEDLTETSIIYIRNYITIVSVTGPHTVNMSSRLYIDSNGKLTLGEGSLMDIVTLRSNAQTVELWNGILVVNDGIKINSINGDCIQMRSEDSKVTITGGTIEGQHSLTMEKGYIDEISGGQFIGNEYAISVYDGRIETISGGIFKMIGSYTANCVTIRNGASIGKITAGEFEAASFAALGIYSGSWVDELSGGTFKSLSTSSNVHVLEIASLSATTDTGIGIISGGTITGGYYGLSVSNSKGKINEIKDIEIDSQMSLITWDAGTIDKISGGVIQASYYGIYNGGRINEIDGVDFKIDAGYYALYNEVGSIGEIKNGLFKGNFCAIYFSSGSINTISGGVFWGQSNYCIYFGSPTNINIEPGLTAPRGNIRFWGTGGLIINDSSNVTLPIGYWMSTDTLPVPGIVDRTFKYLMNGDPMLYNVTVNDSYAADSGAGNYEEDFEVTIDAGIRPGYTFNGWLTNDVTLDDNTALSTTFIMPNYPVTITATWLLNNTPNTGNSSLTQTISLIGLLGSGYIILNSKKKSKKEINNLENKLYY